MHSTEINNLLKSVYKYYPIGIKDWSDFEGTKERTQIVHDKHDLANDSKSVPYLFTNDLQKEVPLLTVHNINFTDFPNYSFVVQLLPGNEGKIVHDSSFQIVVSLLSGYYTYFLADTFFLNGFYAENVPTSFTVLSMEQSHDRTNELLIPVVDLLQKHFPDKRHVPYKLLIDNLVEGRSLFELLFTDAYNILPPGQRLR